MADRLDSLAAIQAACWTELRRACADRDHGWRTPVLATQGDDGVDARLVVLREVDAAGQRLVVYSDSRAAKVQELNRHPRAMLVFWSAPLQWQLRVVLQMQAVSEGLDVTSRWAKLKMSPSAQDYLSPLPPGTPTDAADSCARAAAEIAGARAEAAHLAVLDGEAASLDWMELSPQGHRRARFDAGGARWLQA